jgi:hypothetical protein
LEDGRTLTESPCQRKSKKKKRDSNYVTIKSHQESVIKNDRKDEI